MLHLPDSRAAEVWQRLPTATLPVLLHRLLNCPAGLTDIYGPCKDTDWGGYVNAGEGAAPPLLLLLLLLHFTSQDLQSTEPEGTHGTFYYERKHMV